MIAVENVAGRRATRAPKRRRALARAGRGDGRAGSECVPIRAGRTWSCSIPDATHSQNADAVNRALCALLDVVPTGRLLKGVYLSPLIKSLGASAPPGLLTWAKTVVSALPRRPLDNVEAELTVAQGGHDEPAPLGGRAGLG